MVKKLTSQEIAQKAKDLEGWFADPETSLLQKDFSFENFSDAMVFVNNVGELAEEMNHHPDICISYGTVTLMLTTHEIGGLTQRDFDMAQRIEEIGK